ncbi:MAG TPA: ECF-type sigma factor [Steroidobacteraceae bacterium]|nr:ECF-type sigma factor [Steroidobacteraceae bacterium]
MSSELPDAEADIPSGAPAPLFASLYAELRRIAGRELRRHPQSSVSPTTLVHEAYVSMAGRAVSFQDRARFLGYVARAMRGLLIDFMRQRGALKRGAEFEITHLTTHEGTVMPDSTALTRLSEALDELAQRDPRLAEVVDLRYFCGFSFAEIATLRGASERTVQRDWEKARLLLFHEVELP